MVLFRFLGLRSRGSSLGFGRFVYYGRLDRCLVFILFFVIWFVVFFGVLGRVCMDLDVFG